MKQLTLESIAKQLDMSVRDLRQIVLKQLIDDENVSKRILEAKQHSIQDRQMELMKLQLHNEALQNILLQHKLNRRVWWLKKKESFTKIFTKNGHKEGNQKDQANTQ